MRDIRDRGRDLENVLHQVRSLKPRIKAEIPPSQYTSLVKPAFEEFCLPTKKYADVIVPRGAENTVAIDLISQHMQVSADSNGNLRVFSSHLQQTCRISSGGAAGPAKCPQVNPPIGGPPPSPSLDPTPASTHQLPAAVPAQAPTPESVVRAHLCIVLQFLAQI